MVEITLVCCTCNGKKDIVVSRLPDFAVEFYGIVRDAGWEPVFDFYNGRTLCFCSEKCMEKQLTKRGTLRKRLIKCKKE